MIPQKPQGFSLRLRDYKLIEKIIEEYNLKGETDEVDYNAMSSDEKEVLWKIKTIIRNMEMARLKTRGENTRD